MSAIEAPPLLDVVHLEAFHGIPFDPVQLSVTAIALSAPPRSEIQPSQPPPYESARAQPYTLLSLAVSHNWPAPGRSKQATKDSLPLYGEAGGVPVSTLL